MSYNPKNHHRRSIRLQGYDYSRAGLYFITICVQDRKCLFGKIEDGKLILNALGKVVNECWLEIPKHFPNAILHEHIVMPNHVHGIIELVTVGAENFLPQTPQPPQTNQPSIWQRNYHEHIIRNEQSYQNISDYILSNPSKWNNDIFFN